MNFERLGILVKFMHIKLAYGFITVDEKAEKETFGVKGASGLRMCMSCANCVRTDRPIPAGSDLVLYTESDMSKFERRTQANLKADLDELHRQKAMLTKTGFETLEKILGLKYDHCTVLYSNHWPRLNLPAARYTDWFHDLIASGGVFQYICNAVLHDLVGMGITLQDIDDFQASVRGVVQRLSATFSLTDLSLHVMAASRHLEPRRFLQYRCCACSCNAYAPTMCCPHSAEFAG